MRLNRVGKRLGPGRRLALPGLDVVGPLPGVFLRREPVEALLGSLREDLLQEWNAPAAAGAGAAALGKLAGHLGFVQPLPVHELSPRYVEAITDLIVQVHQRVPGSKLHLLSVGSPTVRNTKDAGMKRLVLCSRNKKKLREMTELLGGLGFDLTDLSPYPNAPEVAETAGSFIGNATLKAATLAPILGEWTIGEDSGLVVPILGGAPGVDSALYAGK